MPIGAITPQQKRLELRQRFDADAPIVVAGAHDGLGARMVGEAGFDGVWASGFELSASYGVPDASIITMTDMLAAARSMNDSTDVPIIADCDTGFGNAVNTIRTIQAFETAGIAGVCIEDSSFPKRCSFYASVRRRLGHIDECRLNIRAAVDARTTPLFVVIARTEALVAGMGLDEALRRAEAYADAGADAILVHSKQTTTDAVAEFAERWERPTPLVCVPTTYNRATVDELWALGFKMVIFANQSLRAAVRAMAETLARLRETGTAASVDADIAPLSEIYRLVDLDRLKREEERYLPASELAPTGVGSAIEDDGTH